MDQEKEAKKWFNRVNLLEKLSTESIIWGELLMETWRPFKRSLILTMIMIRPLKMYQ